MSKLIAIKPSTNILFGINNIIVNSDSDDEDSDPVIPVTVNPKKQKSPKPKKVNSWSTTNSDQLTQELSDTRRKKLNRLYRESTQPAAAKSADQKAEIKIVTLWMNGEHGGRFKINGCKVTYGNDLAGVAQDPDDPYVIYKYTYDPFHDILIITQRTEEDRPIPEGIKRPKQPNRSLLHPDYRRRVAKGSKIAAEDEIPDIKVEIKVKLPKKRLTFV